ncbi:MAG: UDP-3-O-acyl-N-acetylglucosamine deacetylase [Planctomycetia bacterium]|nr:UDP-3-O-acyl-N-acetylglucosamine deacetylase [Planctomycetia bacterium]
MRPNQQTLARSVCVDGFGFWTGRDTRLEFRPAAPGSGIRFFRRDLPDSVPIPALVAFRIKKPRQSSLVLNDASVDMIEHVMAALAAAEIDNCEVVVDSSEMPGCDGSSRPFFFALKEAGIQQQNVPARVRRITTAHVFGDEKSFIRIQPSAANETSFGYRLVYDQGRGPHPIGNQEYESVITPELFEKNIMACRTFLLQEEAQVLLDRGLCSRVSPKDVLVFSESGPVDNKLLFDNECARHKVLDMIGDFALAGCRWRGHFFASRTGHEQNAAVVRELLASDTYCTDDNE